MARSIITSAGADVRFDDFGSGACVLILHGAYSTRHEVRSALEPFFAAHGGHRRIYVDLPGMGESPAHDSFQGSADVVEMFDELIDAAIGSQPLVVIGHSYGAHIARGVAARRPEQVRGIALICPFTPAAMDAEPSIVAQSEGDPTSMIDPAHLDDYLGYFVVQTPETANRFNDAVAPTIGQFDAACVQRIMENWQLEPDPDSVGFNGDTLIVTGRHDSLVGFRRQAELIDSYPRATSVVAGDAGHALPHERPELIAGLLADWLSRVG